QKHLHTHSIHGDERLDNYYWLRSRENPEVIAYLEAENQSQSILLGQKNILSIFSI
ncbi:MAG: hypothetical protein RLZZ381_1819, partial [Cyanobacteriota bacterium]